MIQREHKNWLSDTWPPSYFPHELLAPTMRKQRKVEVRVWAKRLIGNTNLQAQEKKEEKKKIKKRELKREKSGSGVAEREKKQTLEGSKTQKWVSETLNLTRCIKAMEERKEVKPDKRAASRKKREMGWWAADVTKEIVLETSHQQIQKTMVPSWAKQKSLGLCRVTYFHSVYLCSMNLKRRCFASLLQLQSLLSSL